MIHEGRHFLIRIQVLDTVLEKFIWNNMNNTKYASAYWLLALKRLTFWFYSKNFRYIIKFNNNDERNIGKIEELTVYCISKRKRSIHLPTAWAEVQMNILVAVAIIYVAISDGPSLKVWSGLLSCPGRWTSCQGRWRRSSRKPRGQHLLSLKPHKKGLNSKRKFLTT